MKAAIRLTTPTVLERYVVRAFCPAHAFVLMLYDNVTFGNALGKLFGSVVEVHLLYGTFAAHFPTVPASFAVFF